MTARTANRTATRGVLFVHSAPSALCPHIEWAVGGVLGVPVSLDWTPQSAQSGTYRAELSWAGDAGSAAAVASALRGWNQLRFEVTEEPSPGVDGERFCHVPTLGLWSGRTSANGDIVLGEDRLRALVASSTPVQLPGRLHDLLGSAWDEALEPLRLAWHEAALKVSMQEAAMRRDAVG